METYVGHRYVPKIIGEWNKLLSYENLSIVTYDNSSYTSKTIVPVGVEISNEQYWVKTGDYNAQVEEFKNDFTAQLTQTNYRKADIAYVDQSVAVMSGGAIKGRFTTLNSLEEAYPKGANGPFLVDEDSNRYVWDVNQLDWVSIGLYEPAEIEEGSLELDRNAWVDVKKLNLHDASTDTDNFYISEFSGLPVADTSNLYKASDFMLIKGGQKYTNSSDYSGAFFDISENYISGLPADYGGTFTSPLNARLFKSSYLKNEVGVLCEGDKIIDVTAPYAKQKVTVLNDFLAEEISDIANDNLVVGKNKVDIEAISWLDWKYSPNLADPSLIKSGYVSPYSGAIVESSSYKTYIKIKVTPGATLHATSTLNFALYDTDGKYVSHTLTNFPQTTGLQIPSNVHYISISFGSGNTTAMITQNTKYEAYIPYYKDLSFVEGYREQFLKALNVVKSLKIGIIGDSIALHGKSLVDGFMNTISKKLDLEQYNYGISGSTIADGSDPMYLRYDQMRDDLDVVLIEGITNDYAPLGTFEDRTGATIYGALHLLMSGIKKKYPNIPIGVLLPTPRALNQMDTLRIKSEAMKKVAHYYGLPVLDLTNISNGITCAIPEHIPQLYFNGDSLHPSNDSHKNRMAPLIGDFVELLLKWRR